MPASTTPAVTGGLVTGSVPPGDGATVTTVSVRDGDGELVGVGEALVLGVGLGVADGHGRGWLPYAVTLALGQAFG